MLLADELLDQYGYNEPIIANMIDAEKWGVKKESLRRSLNRMVEKNELERYEEGIYYFSKWNNILKQKTKISERAVIERKYVKSKNEVYGYLSGLAFANQIQITTQVPKNLEIVTEKNASKKRKISLRSYTLTLKKPRVDITQQNYKLLQVLDLISENEIYKEVSTTILKDRIKNYVCDIKLSKKEIKQIILKYPAKTAKRLMETEIYDVLI